MLEEQIDTFLLELMGKRSCAHPHLVSAAYYISNKVSGMINPLQDMCHSFLIVYYWNDT